MSKKSNGSGDGVGILTLHPGFAGPLSFLSNQGQAFRIWLLGRRTLAGAIGAGVLVVGGGSFMLLHHNGGGITPVSGAVSRRHSGTPGKPATGAVHNPTVDNTTVPIVMPVNGKVLAGFGWQYSGALNEWYYNPGVTVAAKEGTDVYAAWAGTVKQIVQDAHMGTTLTVDDGNDVTTVYGHMGTLAVKAGQVVKQGQVLGGVGGASIYSRQPGAHLDFDIYHGNVPSNPTSFLHPSS